MSSQTPTREAIDAAHARYVHANPKSYAAHRSAAEVLPGGNTRTVLFFDPFPLTFVKGEGSTLYDADGHVYLDGLGEYTAGIYGHSHPRIKQALAEAIEMGMNLGGHNVHEQALARQIVGRFPSVDKVRFTNSGTEANLMALGTARAHTKRDRILVFQGGYHGGVLYFGTITPVNAPFDVVIAPYNDISGTRALIAQHAHELAAIILEPMLGGAGCIPAEIPFLQMLAEESRARGIVLIFDEVMTSRLSPGGLQAKHGVLPDMTTFGKYMGGGMSFGAFGGREALMAQFDPTKPGALGHAGTFNNNVLTMMAGSAAMSEIYTPEAAVKLNARGDTLRNRLNELCQREEVSMQVTGIGSMMNVHMTREPIRNAGDAAAANQDLRELMFFDLLNDGIYIARRGMINLSLPMTDADLNRVHDGIARFIEQRAELLESI